MKASGDLLVCFQWTTLRRKQRSFVRRFSTLNMVVTSTLHQCVVVLLDALRLNCMFISRLASKRSTELLDVHLLLKCLECYMQTQNCRSLNPVTL